MWIWIGKHVEGTIRGLVFICVEGLRKTPGQPVETWTRELANTKLDCYSLYHDVCTGSQELSVSEIFHSQHCIGTSDLREGTRFKICETDFCTIIISLYLFFYVKVIFFTSQLCETKSRSYLSLIYGQIRCVIIFSIAATRCFLL